MKPTIIIKKSRRLFLEGHSRLVVAYILLAATAEGGGTDNLTHQCAMTQTAMVIENVQKSSTPDEWSAYWPRIIQWIQPPELFRIPQRIVEHGSRHEKRIALTFDACSDSKKSTYDRTIVQILITTRTPATFFLSGKWMGENVQPTRDLASISLFELENNGFLHRHLKQLSDEQIEKDLAWTQVMMFSLIGRQPELFRPPYGEVDDRISRIAAESGLTIVEYDLAYGEPGRPSGKERIVEYISSMTRNGTIIDMQMNGMGPDFSQSLLRIIEKLHSRGFTFVKVSELIGGE
jgi:peptidoglycan-N-acetylglucosamine deacetylase